MESIEVERNRTVATMCEGNPGALVFLIDLIKAEKFETFSALCEIGIVGSDLYVLWNDISQRDMGLCVWLVRVTDRETLAYACGQQDRSGREILKNQINEYNQKGVA